MKQFHARVVEVLIILELDSTQVKLVLFPNFTG